MLNSTSPVGIIAFPLVLAAPVVDGIASWGPAIAALTAVATLVGIVIKFLPEIRAARAARNKVEAEEDETKAKTVRLFTDMAVQIVEPLRQAVKDLESEKAAWIAERKVFLVREKENEVKTEELHQTIHWERENTARVQRGFEEKLQQLIQAYDDKLRQMSKMETTQNGRREEETTTQNRN